jgi:hypothetical protein
MWLQFSLALWTLGQASLERVEAVRAVEETRTALAVGDATAHDPAAIRERAAKQVARVLRQEALLSKRFGLRVSPEILSAEFERIEAHTQDPEGWAAVKGALGNERREIEETVCRPLVVDRLLRLRFAFDDSLQAEAHRLAREARNRFLSGRPVEGSEVLRLARTAADAVDVRAWLAEAKAQAHGPRMLSTPPEHDREPRRDAAIPLHPEAARALETQLRHPGDVSTILSQADRFAVFRLIEVTGEAWTVGAAVFAKRDFEQWFQETAMATREPIANKGP